MNKQDKGKCTLIINGISSKRAKELAEEFAGGEMWWNRADGKSTAYAADHQQPIEIIIN